jgi:hypothetical protein
MDYKTGKCRWKRDEQFRGGRELQLAIYNVAAAKLFEKAKVSEAIYYFATATGKFKKKECPAEKEVHDTLVRVLRTLDDTARAGVFAATPDDDSCKYCDVKAACGSGSKERAARKSEDARLAPVLELRKIK